MIVAIRAWPTFDPNVTTNEPLPFPEPPFSVIQAGESVVAVQAHPGPTDTVTLVDPPPTVNSRFAGVSVRAQEDAEIVRIVV
jgi:hypothetical protein